MPIREVLTVIINDAFTDLLSIVVKKLKAIITPKYNFFPNY